MNYKIPINFISEGESINKISIKKTHSRYIMISLKKKKILRTF